MNANKQKSWAVLLMALTIALNIIIFLLYRHEGISEYKRGWQDGHDFMRDFCEPGCEKEHPWEDLK